MIKDDILNETDKILAQKKVENMIIPYATEF